MFQQKYFTCDWWYNVDCGASQDYYDLNNNLFNVDKYQNVAKIQVKYRQYLIYDGSPAKTSMQYDRMNFNIRFFFIISRNFGK